MEENNPAQPESIEEIAQQTEQPVSSQPPSGVPSKPIYRNKFFYLFALSFLLIAFLIGGFTLGKNQTNVLKVPPPDEPHYISPTSNPTANWKNYAGNIFSLKYPANWFISPGTQSVTISDIQTPGDIPLKIPAEGHQIILVNFFEGEMPANFPEQDGASGQNPTIKAFSINGYSGIRGSSASTIGTTDNVYLKNPAGGYVTLQKEIGDGITFGQILSTFKFTTPQASAQSYLNIPELGIKLQLSNSIKDLVYLPKTVDGKTNIYLSTTSLVNAGGSTCSVDQGPVGILSKVEKAGLTDDPNQPWWNRLSGLRDATTSEPALAKEFPTFFILFTTPQSSCGNNSTIINLQSSATKAVAESIPTVTLTQ